MKLVLHASSLIRVLDGAKISPKHELLAPSTVRSEVLNLLYQDFVSGLRTEEEVKGVLMRPWRRQRCGC